MGCYAPVPWLPAGAERLVDERVVKPLLAQLAAEGIIYTGCLYVGVMWTETGPEVVEFNVRFGDPEAQVLAVYDDRDWLALMAYKAGLAVDAEAVAKAQAKIAHKDRAVAVVMAARGYPFGNARDSAKGTLPRAVLAAGHTENSASSATRVFAASVSPAQDGDSVLTGQGRVLTVCARAEDFEAARTKAYATVREIALLWPDARFRRDIAERAVREEAASP
jgi:phosphoribosylamine--glycine ligase